MVTQPSCTIGQVKFIIQEKFGVTTEELKQLVFANQLLEDGRTLSDYNIQNGAALYIGGMDVHILYWFCPLHMSVGCALVVKVIIKSYLLQWEELFTLGHLLRGFGVNACMHANSHLLCKCVCVCL